MIKIQKGGFTLTVTQGAYRTYYKHLGYEPVDVALSGENLEEESTHTPDNSRLCGDPTQTEGDETPPDEEDEESADEEGGDEEPDLSEIPLSEMGFDQLCEYADKLGLNHDGLRKKSELRAIIREHLK